MKLLPYVNDEELEYLIGGIVAESLIGLHSKYKKRRNKYIGIGALLAIIGLGVGVYFSDIRGIMDYYVIGIIVFSILLFIVLLILGNSKGQLKEYSWEFGVNKIPILLYPIEDFVIPLTPIAKDKQIKFLYIPKASEILNVKLRSIKEVIEDNKNIPAIDSVTPKVEIGDFPFSGRSAIVMKNLLDVGEILRQEYEDKEFQLPILENEELLSQMSQLPHFVLNDGKSVDGNLPIQSIEKIVGHADELYGFWTNQFSPSLQVSEIVEKVFDDAINYLNEYINAKEESRVFLLSQFKEFQDNFALNSFSFYCPNCAEKGLYNEVFYDEERNKWHCPVCGLYHDLEDLIVINKFKINVFYPVFDKLWVEKEDEIHRIDREYQKEINEISRHIETEIRAAKDRFKQELAEERRTIRAIKSEIMAYGIKIAALTETLDKYKEFSAESLDRYTRDANKIKENALSLADKASKIISKNAAKSWEEGVQESRELQKFEKIEEQKRNEELFAKKSESVKLLKVMAANVQRRVVDEKIMVERYKASKSHLPMKLVHKLKANHLQRKSNTLTDYIIKEKI